jgi:hypothetical protein
MAQKCIKRDRDGVVGIAGHATAQPQGGGKLFLRNPCSKTSLEFLAEDRPFRSAASSRSRPSKPSTDRSGSVARAAASATANAATFARESVWVIRVEAETDSHRYVELSAKEVPMIALRIAGPFAAEHTPLRQFSGPRPVWRDTMRLCPWRIRK